MSHFGILPVFSQTIQLGLTEVQERIVQAVEGDVDGRFEVKNFPHFICLRIREEDRHFWTPRLNLSLEETTEGHTHIEGTYGPNANVWGLLLYGYLIIGMLGIFAGALGFSQWMIGKQPWGLWIFGGLALIAVAISITAQVGKRIGAQQMLLIHQTYESAIGTMVKIH